MMGHLRTSTLLLRLGLLFFAACVVLGAQYVFASPASPTLAGSQDASGGTTNSLDNSDTNKVFISGNYMYVAKTNNSTTCVQGGASAIGCELQIYDISTPSTPTYVGGADSTGSANNGVGSIAFNSVYVSGSYAYVVAGGRSSACSQTAGSADGCELKVFDISTPATPTYVGGADVSGSTNSGTDNLSLTDVYVSGNYAYVAKAASATACSQTAGSAIGCELQVYDISTPATPTYVGGADTTGSTNSGTGNSGFNSVHVSNGYAYIAKGGNSTACSQTAGSAIGCELQLYDISTPATPTYVGGADSTGSTNSGAGNQTFASVYVSGNYAYVATIASATACSQTAGSATGCELQVYDISTPATPTYVGGADGSGSTNSGTGSAAANNVFISGNYAYVAKAASATACSQTAGSAIGCELQVYDISTPATPTYVGGADASGSTNSGTGSVAANGVFVSSNYAYLAKAGSATDCTLSDKTGCELLIFDTTTPATPTLAASRDASGSTVNSKDNLAFNDVYVSGNYAYVATTGNSTTCVQSGATVFGCELKVFDISTPATPTYVGGADASGSTNSSTGSLTFNDIFVSGNYAYVATNNSITACSQTAGSAIGCELKVFDISTPATPTYVGGADSGGGTNTGAVSSVFNSIYVSGNYAYVAKAASATACSQTPGSAIGCELQVYDISTPSTPTYVGGADASGSSNSGVDSLAFNSVYVSGNYAYVVTAGSGTACSQTAGSAIGCELKVFDISTPATPTYVGGADAGGSANTGSINTTFNEVYVSGNYAYVASSNDTTTCSQTVGSARGCELKVFNISTPATPTYVGGADSSGSTNSGTSNVSLGDVFVSGNYAYIAKGASATACSQTPGSAIGCELQVYDISTPSTPTYVGGADASGSSNSGTGSVAANGVFVSSNYAYLAKAGSATDCASSDKTGCELLAFDVSPPPAPPAPRTNLINLIGGFLRLMGGQLKIY